MPIVRLQQDRSDCARPAPGAALWYIACLWFCAVTAWACGPDAVAPPSSDTGAQASTSPALNILLISVDTLREDRLGHAGYGRDTSPHIDRLAAESLVFTRAYSQAGWTLPSMASVMTGRSPAAHGATHFYNRMDRSIPTLASRLADHGYSTHAYVSHILLRKKYGFDVGFEHLDASVLTLGRPKDVKSAAMLTDRAITRLEGMTSPFFLWVHYFDPHNDYLAHAEWSEFGSTDSDRYDQEIAWTDAQIGRLLTSLEVSGHADDTLIVLTADHGEEFADHGGSYHYTLHEEVIRIPLIVHMPGATPGQIDVPVQQIDLLPTILSAAGLPADPGLPGRDLLAETIPATPIFIERERPSRFHQRAMIHEGGKLVVVESVPEDEQGSAPQTPTEIENIEPGVFYYDLDLDPDERSPIDPKQDPRARVMLETMARHFEDMPAGAAEAVELEPETEEALRALGYLK